MAPTNLLVSWPGGQQIMEGPFTAGRKADLVVDDQYASPVHAQFRVDSMGWAVEDMGSTNGTYRIWAPGEPEERVRLTAPLTKGSQVRIGQTVLTVVPL